MLVFQILTGRYELQSSLHTCQRGQRRTLGRGNRGWGQLRSICCTPQHTLRCCDWLARCGTRYLHMKPCAEHPADLKGTSVSCLGCGFDSR
jgi:hypothetical protein